MAMVICRECKAEISTLAHACLHCGARRKTPAYAFALAAVLGLVLASNAALLWRLYALQSDIAQAGLASHAR
jgi:hypothetical protein